MRILVAEDEIGIAKFLKQGLEEESYAVDICDEGKKAFQLALSGEYDLLLLDWMIPGMSGIEICRQFRKQDKETPIIILTAKDTVEETIFGLQAGANDYIKKPFHFDELLERIRVQLRSKASVENVLILGDIEMDLNTHQINRSGSEVQLTQKEFALLEYLIRNKGKVCRRTRILDSVWDITFQYNTGVIDVHINSLRKKLNLPNDYLLKTIRGVGYIANDQ